MARGTIYSHVPDVEGLFEEVAARLAHEMIERVEAGFAGVDDPAARLSIGVRQYIRRAHEEPLWGRFMSRFGLSPALLQALLESDPLADLQAGMDRAAIASAARSCPPWWACSPAARWPPCCRCSTATPPGATSAPTPPSCCWSRWASTAREARAIATAELPPLPPLG